MIFTFSPENLSTSFAKAATATATPLMTSFPSSSAPRIPTFAPLPDSSMAAGPQSVPGEAVEAPVILRLVSYNILAQAYLRSHFSPHSPSHCLRWKARSQKLLAQLLSFDADVLCLQELDEYEGFYKGGLGQQGYFSIYAQRPGRKDGSAIFYRPARLEIIETEFIHFNDLVPEYSSVHKEAEGVPETRITVNHEHFSRKEADRGDPKDPNVRLKRDCVGIMAAFRVLPAPKDRIFLLANTQIYWDPDFTDVKLAQVKYLIDRVLKFRDSIETHLQLRKLPVIICGDFNSTPGDVVYNYLDHGGAGVSTENMLSNSSLDSENKVSGKCVLPLYSLYGSVSREPECTNCAPGFKGTLDYIFFSSFDRMKPLSLLQIPTLDSEDVRAGLPNQTYLSDHLPIGTDFTLLGSIKE